MSGSLDHARQSEIQKCPEGRGDRTAMVGYLHGWFCLQRSRVHLDAGLDELLPRREISPSLDVLPYNYWKHRFSLYAPVNHLGSVQNNNEGEPSLGGTAVFAGPSATMLHAPVSPERHMVAFCYSRHPQRVGFDLLHSFRCECLVSLPIRPTDNLSIAERP